MSRNDENTGFICAFCGEKVLPLSNGGYRNHCPFCLCSMHVDVHPGDRLSRCGGLMKPIGLDYKSGKGFQVIHRCLACGTVRKNKVASDTILSDSIEALAGLSQAAAE